ncbi:MAG: diguanylate cyclase, partial [Candidatus Eisenbacteria bacterium]|nr:diguanylate cyclase [Candidatus Latescibacterota bacterium]MBD3301801.1 diguanylate cyclase [Candidatus Eisenbacteria bacterium]
MSASQRGGRGLLWTSPPGRTPRKGILKRIPISYLALLRDILPREPLTPEELDLRERALVRGDPVGIRETVQRLVRALIDRKHLQIVERIDDPFGPLLRLLDPRTHVRFLIRLQEPRTAESIDVIPLPLRPPPIASVRADLVRQMVGEQARLVGADRVAGPREIIHRLETAIRDALGIDAVTLLPIEQPNGQFWTTDAIDPLPLPEVRLRELAKSRTYLLHVRDFARLDPRIGAHPGCGSALYIGIGDDTGGWRAVLEAREKAADGFSSERVQLAVLLAGHFQTLLANAVRLQSFMFYDYLTGIHNRAYFEDQFEKMLAAGQRHEQAFALCIIDVDDFRDFNKLYGYDGGDRVLATVGCVLRNALRTSDTIARYGGEEFAALLDAPVTPEEAGAIAERLRSAVETEPFQVRNLHGEYVSEGITVSIGGALFPAHGASTRDLWTTANRMLIEAKEQGKNRVRFGPAPAGGSPGPAT